MSGLLEKRKILLTQLLFIFGLLTLFLIVGWSFFTENNGQNMHKMNDVKLLISIMSVPERYNGHAISTMGVYKWNKSSGGFLYPDVEHAKSGFTETGILLEINDIQAEEYETEAHNYKYFHVVGTLNQRIKISSNNFSRLKMSDVEIVNISPINE